MRISSTNKLYDMKCHESYTRDAIEIIPTRTICDIVQEKIEKNSHRNQNSKIEDYCQKINIDTAVVPFSSVQFIHFVYSIEYDCALTIIMFTPKTTTSVPHRLCRRALHVTPRLLLDECCFLFIVQNEINHRLIKIISP